MRTVREFAREHALLVPGPIVVAVSGGTDSTALALILAELRAELGLVLHVAHFDHRARPDAAPGDAAFVADLANHIGARLRVGRADRAPASEDDARRARYEFLRRVGRAVAATAIATGHTRDDQAETVLLHLTRGSGLAGLAGMRPLRDGIVRPLLAIGRADTAAICAAAGVTAREDATNASLRFARNRIRLRVLPELERINPRVREALARFAEAAAQTEAASPRGACPASALDLSALPDGADRQRALADAWQAVTGRVLTAAQRSALTRLTSTGAGTRRIDLPGGAAVREYGTLRLGVREDRPAVAGPLPLRRGEPALWQGWRIALDMPPDGLPHRARVRASDAAGLVVRSRRPGDRLAGGRKKVQDVLVDAKVPAARRDGWPLVTLNEQVVWIPGITRPPRAGRVPLAAGPVGDDPTPVSGATVGSGPRGQVASMTEARPRGGKRGRG